tara:strand:- start:1486 stop:1857 length:372 start_codon:yes stop_codon:yes gene_type:complete
MTKEKRKVTNQILVNTEYGLKSKKEAETLIARYKEQNLKKYKAKKSNGHFSKLLARFEVGGTQEQIVAIQEAEVKRQKEAQEAEQREQEGQKERLREQKGEEAVKEKERAEKEEKKVKRARKN